MRRDEIEHLIAAAANIAEDEIVVIGSQAVLGEFPEAPPQLLVSLEADVYPRHDPERSIEIDGAIGHGSQFHETYGYYAHGIGPEAAVAPAGWEARLIRVDVPAIPRRNGHVTAWFMTVDDLLVSKLAAGRPHDLEFVEVALREGLADVETLRLDIELVPVAKQVLVRRQLEVVMSRLDRQ